MQKRRQMLLRRFCILPIRALHRSNLSLIIPLQTIHLITGSLYSPALWQTRTVPPPRRPERRLHKMEFAMLAAVDTGLIASAIGFGMTVMMALIMGFPIALCM